MDHGSWDERELPILTAVDRACEEGAEPNRAAIDAVPGLSKQLYIATVASLIEGGYLHGPCQRNGAGDVQLVLIEGLTPKGLEAVGRWHQGAAQPTDSGIAVDERDPRRVFLVQGRNQAAAAAVTDLLAAAGLLVLGWEEAVRVAGGGTPYTLDVVRAGMAACAATVVLLTPDDVGCLDPRLWTDDPADEHEREMRGRPRQNVVLEAGMALAGDDSRTVLVELGQPAGLSDLAGKNTVRLNGTAARRKALLQRLRDIGCEVNMDSDRWLHAGDIDGAVLPPTDTELSIAPDIDEVVSRPVVRVPDFNPLDMFHPSGVTAPSGAPIDLVFRCAVLVPAAALGPNAAAEPACSIAVEDREEQLGALLDGSELTRWLTRARRSFDLDDIPSWRPHGYNAGEVSALVVEPPGKSADAGPVFAGCTVHTGWVSGPDARATRGMRVVADLGFRILELSSERTKSADGRWNGPGPAPGALSLDEAAGALVAVMSIADVASDAYAELLSAGPPLSGLLTCWISTTGGAAMDAVIDISEFSVIPGSGTPSEARVVRTLPMTGNGSGFAPLDARREAARELIGGLLERSGRRGFRERVARV